MTNREFVSGLKKTIRANHRILISRDRQTRNDKFLKKYREAVNVYDNKYLSCREYSNIRGLYFFCRENQNVSLEELEHAIKLNRNTFSFLNRVIDLLPNALEDLINKGPRYIATKYINANALEIGRQLEEKNNIKG